MNIHAIPCGYLQANCYIVYEKDGGDCLVIDPGYKSGKYIDFLSNHDLRCTAILLTHRHPDHVHGAVWLAEKCSAPIFMHKLDAEGFKGHVDYLLSGGEELELAGHKIRILHTPGHTEGGICIYFSDDKIVFSGDTIFDIDLGSTEFAGGSEAELAWSCKNVIDKWEDDVIVYPGHDVHASMEYIRKNNKEFIALRDGKKR